MGEAGETVQCLGGEMQVWGKQGALAMRAPRMI